MTETTNWIFCKVLSRVRGEAIRVLEKHPTENRYREKIYNGRDGLDDIKGEIYE